MSSYWRKLCPNSFQISLYTSNPQIWALDTFFMLTFFKEYKRSLPGRRKGLMTYKDTKTDKSFHNNMQQRIGKLWYFFNIYLQINLIEQRFCLLVRAYLYMYTCKILFKTYLYTCFFLGPSVYQGNIRWTTYKKNHMKATSFKIITFGYIQSV